MKPFAMQPTSALVDAAGSSTIVVLGAASADTSCSFIAVPCSLTAESSIDERFIGASFVAVATSLTPDSFIAESFDACTPSSMEAALSLDVCT